MDSTTKDELKIKIPQSMLRTPKEIWNDNKMDEKQIDELKDILKRSCKNILEAQEDIEDNHSSSAAFWLGAVYSGIYDFRKKMNFIEEGEL